MEGRLMWKWRLGVLIGVVFSSACGGFHDPKADGTSKILGQAALANGSAAADASVFFVVDDLTRVAGRTDSNGAFTLESVPVGRGQLVVNAGDGLGALLDVVSYREAEVNLGIIPLSTLQEHPEILKLRGVGYDERLTDGLYEVVRPVLNSDGTFAIAIRDSGTTTELIKIDLVSGEVHPLFTGARAHLESKALPLLSLIADRYVVFIKSEGHSILNPNDQSVTWKPATWVFDLETGRDFDFGQASAVAASLDPKWSSHAWAPRFWMEEGHLFHLEIRSIHENVFGPYAVFELQLVRLNPNTGELKLLPLKSLAPPSDRNDLFWSLKLFGRKSGHLYYAGYNGCIGAMDCTPADVENRPWLQFFDVDLHAMTLRHVGQLRLEVESTELSFSAENDAVFFNAGLNHDDILRRFDLKTGLTSDVDSATNLQLFWSAPLAIPGRRELLLQEGEFDAGGTRRRLSMYRYDPVTRVREEIPLSLTAPEIGTWYDFTLIENGQLRVSYPDSVTKERVSVDFSLDGQRVDRRVFPSMGTFEAFRQLKVSPDQSVEATIQNVNGFLQVVSRGARSAQPHFRQITHVAADHTFIGLSPDGGFAYSMARDPLSGRPQLFRAATKRE